MQTINDKFLTEAIQGRIEKIDFAGTIDETMGWDNDMKVLKMKCDFPQLNKTVQFTIEKKPFLNMIWWSGIVEDVTTDFENVIFYPDGCMDNGTREWKLERYFYSYFNEEDFKTFVGRYFQGIKVKTVTQTCHTISEIEGQTSKAEMEFVDKELVQAA